NLHPFPLDKKNFGGIGMVPSRPYLKQSFRLVDLHMPFYRQNRQCIRSIKVDLYPNSFTL
ncbi:hypothetical protein ACE41B_30915, partial [Bacillus cereus]|uniref:hypothetical protein n=1 Tax=Bacillus cereus TaxID=1396 RepID=UPI0035CBA0B5